MMPHLATQLFGAILKKGVAGFIERLIRIRAVDRAFQYPETSTAPESLTNAFRDIENVLGHAGVLTERLATFLALLRDTQIPVSMATSAFLKIDSPGARIAFDRLFRMQFPSGEFSEEGRVYDADRLYQALQAMIGASVHSQGKGRAERFLLEHLARLSLSERSSSERTLFEKSEDAIWSTFEPVISTTSTGLLRKQADWLNHVPTDAAKLLSEIATRLRSDFTHIWVEGPEDRGHRGVPAEEIFVDVRVQPRIDGNSDDLGEETGGEIHYTNIPSLFHRAVILGDPGGGKSTLCQMLCLDALNRCTQGMGALAVRIEMRKFEAATEFEAQLSLFTYIVREVSRITNVGDSSLSDALRYFLGVGLVTVVFDGLDEIIAVNRRRDLVSNVAGFASSFPLCPILVTSRRVGYVQAPMPVSDFTVLELKSFNRDEVGQYVYRAAKSVFKKNDADAKTAEMHFTERLSVEAQELVQIPLMLALMVWLYHENRGKLPSDRASLYQECSLLMFERWDKLRGIDPEIPAEFDLLDLLTYLAAKIYLDPSLTGGVDGLWLLSKIKNFFQNIYLPNGENNHRATAAARKVIKFITGRAWVMTEKGADVYDFTHRTFLEYFFARHLNNEFEISELGPLLLPKILNGQWNVSSHLAIQLKISGRPKAAALIAQILASGLADVDAKNAPDVVSFLVELCQYLLAPESEMQELGRILGRWIPALSTAKSHLDKLGALQNPRYTAVFRGVAHGVAAVIEHDYDAVSRVYNWTYDVKLLVISGQNVDLRLREFLNLLGEILGPELEKRSPPTFPKLLFNLTGRVDGKCSDYGVLIWVPSAISTKMYLATDLMIMLSQIWSHISDGEDLANLPYASLANATVASFRAQAPISYQVPPSEISIVLPSSFRWERIAEFGNSAFFGTLSTIALMCLELVSVGKIPAWAHFFEKGFSNIDARLAIASAALHTANADGSDFFGRYILGEIRLFSEAHLIFLNMKKATDGST
jgi:hypothetical protein